MYNKNRFSSDYITLICAILLTIPLLSNAQQTTPIKVATTHPIITEWVKAVGGEHVTVIEMNKEQPSALADVDIIYENGLGSDTWMSQAYAEQQSNASRIILSDGLETMPIGSAYWKRMPPPNPHASQMPACCKANAEDENQQWDALVENINYQPTPSDPTTDPYLYYDVNNAKSMLVTINETLAEEDEANTETYDANTKKYLKELDTLEKEIRAMVRKIPLNKRQFTSENNSFRYFAKRYGLIAIPKDANDQQIIIFEESPADAENASSTPTLYTIPSQSPNSRASSYKEMMHTNTNTIAKELMK